MTKKIAEIGILEIMRLLPHRPPFLLVDRVENVIPCESGVGVKNVSINEPFFEGHFPNNPIMPGVLQVEAMAQSAGVVILCSYSPEEVVKKGILFMTIDAVKFRKQVLPGDVLQMHVKKLQQKKNIYKFKGEAFVGDKKVSECVFSAMIVDKE